MSKHIVITGSSTGIGAALTKHYLGKGWFVTGIGKTRYDSDSDHYDHITLNFNSENIGCLDVKQPVDCLFLNSGIVVYKNINDLTEDEMTKVFNINVKGNLSVLNGLKKCFVRNPLVVFNSSISVDHTFPSWGLYSSMKIAMEKLLETYSDEEGINSLILRIGPVNTPIWDKVTGSEKDKNMKSAHVLAEEIYNQINTSMVEKFSEYSKVVYL